MKKANIKTYMITLVLFVVYMYSLIKIILFKFGPINATFLLDQLYNNLDNPILIKDRLLSGNLAPFTEITHTLNHMTAYNFINLTGNIGLFIPFGMFLLLIFKNKIMSLKRVFYLSFMLSLCLEGSQLIFSIGIFDVDDLLLNTLGGMIGYVILKFNITYVRTFSVKSKDYLES